MVQGRQRSAKNAQAPSSAVQRRPATVGSDDQIRPSAQKMANAYRCRKTLSGSYLQRKKERKDTRRTSTERHSPASLLLPSISISRRLSWQIQSDDGLMSVYSWPRNVEDASLGARPGRCVPDLFARQKKPPQTPLRNPASIRFFVRNASRALGVGGKLLGTARESCSTST